VNVPRPDKIFPQKGKILAKTALLTPREAAEIGGLSLNSIEKAIEQRVVRPVRVDSRQLLAAREVAVLVLLRQVPVPLPVVVKRRAREWFMGLRRGVVGAELEFSPALTIRGTREVAEALERAERYVRLRDRYVEVNPRVMGGEPVIRDTRVPVRDLAELIALGESREVLSEDFPQVAEEAYELAVQWARANPRRGRPVPPWRRRTTDRTGRPAPRPGGAAAA
jgi:uncharacterized protein (DUF433 family)